MWEDIIKLAVGNGLWAVLSVVLLSYLLKDSRRREQKYTDIISGLSEKLKIVGGIKKDTEKLTEDIAVLTQKIAPVEKKNVKKSEKTERVKKPSEKGESVVLTTVAEETA